VLKLSQIFREKKFYFDLLKELKITKISCSVEENVQYDALYDYCVDRNLYHRGLVSDWTSTMYIKDGPDQIFEDKVLIPVYWEWKPISKVWEEEYYVLDVYAEYIPDSIIIKCNLINKLRNIEEYTMCAFSKEEFEKNGFEVIINTSYPEEEE
jgi:hypothetical protein